jgi:hypothetical protein
MSKFNTIPEEILLYIFSFSDTRGVIRFSEVSQVFERTVDRYIQNEIQVGPWLALLKYYDNKCPNVGHRRFPSDVCYQRNAPQSQFHSRSEYVRFLKYLNIRKRESLFRKKIASEIEAFSQFVQSIEYGLGFLFVVAQLCFVMLCMDKVIPLKHVFIPLFFVFGLFGLFIVLNCMHEWLVHRKVMFSKHATYAIAWVSLVHMQKLIEQEVVNIINGTPTAWICIILAPLYVGIMFAIMMKTSEFQHRITVDDILQLLLYISIGSALVLLNLKWLSILSTSMLAIIGPLVFVKFAIIAKMLFEPISREMILNHIYIITIILCVIWAELAIVFEGTGVTALLPLIIVLLSGLISYLL